MDLVDDIVELVKLRVHRQIRDWFSSPAMNKGAHGGSTTRTRMFLTLSGVSTKHTILANSNVRCQKNGTVTVTVRDMMTESTESNLSCKGDTAASRVEGERCAVLRSPRQF